jgi:CcmD family protein
MTYLYAAYAATWLIHIAYLGSIFARYRKLQQEMQELKEK